MRVDRAHGRRLVIPLAIVALLSSLAAAPVAAVRAPSGQGANPAPQDADPLPGITLSASPATVKEGDAGTTTLSFVVSIDQVSGSNVTFDWATQDGSATVADNDYVAGSGSGTILAGSTFTTVSITVNGDTTDENPYGNTEYMNLALSNVVGTLNSSTSTNGFIYDDDAQDVPGITLSASPATVKEGDAGTTTLSFVVSIDQVSGSNVTFDWATQDGSATVADNDYVAGSGSGTILAGSTFTTVSITVNGDTTDENPYGNTEYMNLALSNVVGTLNSSTSTNGFIYDDDAQDVPGITLSASPATVKEGDAGTTTLSFVVSIDQVSGSNVTFDWATQDGSATVADNDYVAGSGSGTILAGSTFTTVSITVNGDTTDEFDYEYNGLSLSNIVGTLNSSTSTNGYIYDDDGAGVPLPAPTVYITSPTIVEGNAGTKTLTFTVWLDRLATGTVSVNRATQDNGATAPSDYTALSTSALTWTAGQQVKTVNVTVNGDTADEGYSEGVLLYLTTPSGVVLSSTYGYGTILDDDETPVPLPTLYITSPTIVEGNAGTKTLTFTVWLDRLATGTVSVNRATQDNGATAPSDYTALSTSALTWTAGQQVKTVNVTVNGDTADEGYSEGVLLYLTTPSGVVLSSTYGYGTILDDDETPVPLPTLYITSPTIVEGNAGTKTLTFTVWLDRLATGTVSVNRATQDNGATAPSDYTPLSTSAITWTAGQQVKTVDVTVIGDCADEGPYEGVLLNLTAPSGTALYGATGYGYIWDDDLVSCAQLSVNDPSTTEGTGGTKNLTFTVTRSGVTTGTTTVNYTTNAGTATASSDYTTTSGSLSFTSGQTTKSINVPLVTDSVDELDEQLTLTLSGASAGTQLTKATGTGTISNDDDPFVSIADATKDPEGSGGGTSNLAFTVSLEHASLQDVGVSYQTTAGSAVATADYTTTTGTLTILAGQLSGAVNVPVVRDDIDEPATETFTVTLSNPTNSSLGTPTATGTIVDDDGAPIPNLTIADASKDPEGNSGSTAMTFPVTLSATSLSDVTVEYSTSAGSATPGADFTSVGSGLVTIPAGQTTANATVLVDGDLLDEANETLTVTLASPTGASILDGTAAGTIVDDDATPSLSMADASTTEGDSGTKTLSFVVTLSAASGRTVTVAYATSPGTATSPEDFTAVAGTTLTFNPGETSKNATVSIIGDTVDEGVQAFTVNLSGPSNATLFDGTATGTITDDDAAGTVLVSINDRARNPEGNANGPLTFTVSLSAPAAGTVTVNYATSNGTAGAPADYTATAGTVTFAPGETSKTFTVTIAGDTIDESDETFFVTLSGPSGATLGDAVGVGTIIDDDAAPSLSIADAATSEGSGAKSLVFTVTLSPAAGSTVSVDYGTSAVSASPGSDYNPKSGTLTFTAGETTKTFAVTILGDAVCESTETFNLILADPTGAVLADPQGVGMIVDDDCQSTLSIADKAKSPEGDANGTLSFTVTRSGGTGGTATVHFAMTDGTASDGTDYIAASGDLTFGPGIPTRTISVPINGDLLDEPDETFFVMLSAPTGAVIGDGSAVGTIVDDDAPPSITVTAKPASDVEGTGPSKPRLFEIALSAVSGKVVTVDFATAPGTATAGSDFLPRQGTLLWLPGQKNKMISVTTNADDDCESDESFSVAVSHPLEATIGTAGATATLADDDCPAASVADASIKEAATNVSVTVTMAPTPGSSVSVKYATSAGTATAGSDYTTKTGTLNFSSGQASQTISVAILDDTLDEGDETFTITLSNPSAGVTISDATATVTITDCTVLGTPEADDGHDAGHPRLSGTAGADTICGRGGNDIILPGAGNDEVRGGTGTDTVDYTAAPNAVTVDLLFYSDGRGRATGWGTDTLAAVENATGSAFDDTLIGNAGANVLDGNAGDDDIDGQAGNDTMRCDTGTEDTARWSGSPNAVTVNLADATDSATGWGTDDVSGCENAIGSSKGDTINGNGAANDLFGGAGNDTLHGAGGNDVLNGSTGNDSLHGQDGNDTLNGNDGNDDFYGGPGNDTFNGGADTLSGSGSGMSGGDTVSFGLAGAAVTASLASKTASGEGSDTFSDIEIIGGSGFSDTLTGDSGVNGLHGGNGNDTINGGGGGDFLTGSDGKDTIHGNDGNDDLAGGDDADKLYGDAGNDTITGGTGAAPEDNDLLNGGTGTDDCHDNFDGTDTLVSCESGSGGQAAAMVMVLGLGPMLVVGGRRIRRGYRASAPSDGGWL